MCMSKSESVVVYLNELLGLSDDWHEPSASELRITYEIIQRLKEIRDLKTEEEREQEKKEDIEEEIKERVAEKVETILSGNIAIEDASKALLVEPDDSFREVKAKYIEKRCIELHEDKTWDEIAELLGMASNSLVRWRRDLFEEDHPCHPDVPEDSQNTFEGARQKWHNRK